jgi:hypothetical protein
LEILDADGQAVGIVLQVFPNGASHITANDGEGRTVLRFRPATLQIGADGNPGGLLVRDRNGAPVFNFNASTALLQLGTVEHLGEVILAGNLTVNDSDERAVLRFASSTAELTLGAAGQNGALTIKDSLDGSALRFNAAGAELSVGGPDNAGELLVRDANNRLVFFFRSDFAELRIGEESNAGDLIMLDHGGREVLRANGQTGTLAVGARENGGTLIVRDTEGHDAFSFDTGVDGDDPFSPTGAFARIGTRESPGRLQIRNADDRNTLVFTSDNARLVVGAGASSGHVEVRDSQERPVVEMDGDNARLRVGAAGHSGRLVVRDGNGEVAVVIDSVAGEPGVVPPGSAPTPATGTARVRIGGPRTHGDLVIEDGDGRSALHFNSADAAVLRFGSRAREGRLLMKNSSDREVFSFESDRALIHIGSDGTERILVDGAIGDIHFRNADVAERFEIADGADAAPGTLMVLGDDQRLRPCSSPYDRRVVGVVSGAGSYRPGIVMDSAPETRGHIPVSVVGKVSCRVDARAASIAVGDLLTTSPTPGHAMKVTEPHRAFGAVVGKALSSLESGVGLVKMLVALQ